MPMTVDSRRVLLVGATGRVGRFAARDLVACGASVRALVRDEVRAASLLPAPVELHRGDLSQPETLAAAVDGIDAVLLVVPVSERQAELEGALVAQIEALCRDVLIVKVSGLGTAPGSRVPSGALHAQTEALIRASALPFVFLHPLFFMQNLAFQFESVRRNGVVRAGVGDARIAMIDAADIAAVAARLLSGEVVRTGRTLRLTAGAAVGYADVAAELQRWLNRPVSYVPQSIDALREQLIQAGQHPWHVELLCQFNRAFAAGMAEAVSDDVQQVLGRQPRSLAVYLHDALTSDHGPAGEDPFRS
jgi:uncharacterized protein YbjT (DUF2867 family)